MKKDRSGSVLIVDDNANNRDLLAQRLLRMGHEITESSNGEDALKCANEQDFDLVLLDVMMPGMNGYEVLERLKENPKLRHIPVLMVSALTEMESVVKCIELGAEDYLPKPFKPVLLKARVESCLERKFARDQEALYLCQLEEEKKRSDELLNVILPEPVVKELKETQSVRPRKYEAVSVLFADIVGFTKYCEEKTPEEVLENLQKLVSCFENVCADHKVEKIKTIGDAFMCVAGLLIPLENSVMQSILCAKEMVKATKEMDLGWSVRIGISYGEVIAGVVGHKKYLYDVWGDTVNFASRLEGLADPNTACISEKAWDCVKSQCEGEALSAEVKGKGIQLVYKIPLA